MTNHTNHYFGPYLEIKVKAHYDSVYPDSLVAILPEGKWEGILRDITPMNLEGKGTIIAASDQLKPIYWMNLSEGEWEHSVQTKEFPTAKEVEEMKADLQTNCASAIEALQASGVVTSVVIKAGYVLDEER